MEPMEFCATTHCHRIAYCPLPPDIVCCLVNTHNHANKHKDITNESCSSLDQCLRAQRHVIAKALTVDDDANLKYSHRRQKHSIRGRLISVSPLYQQPKDRTKSFCFFDIGSEESLLTTHVYLRGLNAETWHSFLRVGDCCVVTHLCSKILEAVDSNGKSELKYSVLVPCQKEKDATTDNATQKNNEHRSKRRRIEKNSTLTTMVFRVDATSSTKKSIKQDASISTSESSSSPSLSNLSF